MRGVTLDRTSPLPLWAQLEAELRAQLLAGDFGERFPTDAELVERYGVSRQTVRQAIARLTSDGLVERHRGRGTVVVTTRIEQPVGTIYSLFSLVESQGLEQRSEVLELAEVVDEEIASRLGLPTTAPLVHLSRVRCAGTEPLALDHSWLPASLAAPLLEADFTRTALYDELADRCGVHVDGGWERVEPVLLSPADRELLHLGRRPVAGFSVERIGRAGGRDVEYRRTLLAGERYSLVMEWSPSMQAPVRAAAAPAE